MLKLIIGSLFVVTLGAPALADEFWVQYDYNTHECSVVQSATHQTATRFPWSPPNDGRRPQEVLKGPGNGSTEGATTNAANETATPNGSGTTSEATNENGTSNPSNTVPGVTNDTSKSAASNTTNSAGVTNNAEQSESPVAAAWKRKAELAREKNIEVATALIGSPMQSREEAEEEMQIMRRCGLKN